MSNQFNIQFLVSGVQPDPEICSSLENHVSRRKQFFLSLSASLSPLFTSCGSLISTDELYNFLVNRLGGVEVKLSHDGTEVPAVNFNDKQLKSFEKLWIMSRLPDRARNLRWYQCNDADLLGVPKADRLSDAFVTKRIGEIDMTKMELSDNPDLAEAFVASQLNHHNIIKPRAYFLARNIKRAGGIFKGVYCMSPCLGVGDFGRFRERYFSWFDIQLESEAHSSCNAHSNAKVPLREALMAPIIKGAINGLQYMHEKNLVHGDFKLENVVVCEDPNQELGYTGKLIDFGLSCKDGTPGVPSGTIHHMAPESEYELRTTKKKAMDIWALGTNLFFLFTATLYNTNISKLREAAMKGRKELSAGHEGKMKAMNLSESLKELIRTLLVLDPSKRPDCDKILKSSWFKECDEVISAHQDCLERAMKRMAEKSAKISLLPVVNEDIKTCEDDPVIPGGIVYLKSPKEEEEEIKNNEFESSSNSQNIKDVNISPEEEMKSNVFISSPSKMDPNPVIKSSLERNSKNDKNSKNNKNDKNDKNDKISNPKTADVSRLRNGFCRDGLRSLKNKACSLIDKSSLCRRLFCLNKK